jgi:hypothetical protein
MRHVCAENLNHGNIDGEVHRASTVIEWRRCVQSDDRAGHLGVARDEPEFDCNKWKIREACDEGVLH